jgi:hypothetical protein
MVLAVAAVERNSEYSIIKIMAMVDKNSIPTLVILFIQTIKLEGRKKLMPFMQKGRKLCSF